MIIEDSTRRFSDRVADYVKYRPTYPREVVTFVHAECAVAPGAPVADIGAGTGISARLFLDAGHPVFAVEPNAAMRAAADAWLAGFPAYRSVAGTAEATTLDAASVDLVIAAQAFHWFDKAGARREFARILKPRGAIALFWNSRLLEGSAFLTGYEALLQRYCPDYARVAESYPDDAAMADWFGDGFEHRTVFPNAQWLDFDGLKGRLMSSSYAPKAGDPHHEPMLAALRELFDATARDGRVNFEYETRVYAGRPLRDRA
ncbi:class I SAM-dependent methyltransferase [Paraburkholderia caballeronis]|uniref:Methyltransferase domain-containing protein n=1 Tax=Paraburkholderia caballeronis TaxID=416943 RepID=A0A1H7IXJ0_9BURK|nr:class I SAM-dependent methyltransferase [Paraburkholderia caballeronis]PXW27650.1 methyltransferase family protein [Paraburkholderia caballeronis]PXX03124.1 methyltransferase family protein [Paraburkholderia caballeronis]RAK03849.1 methyltransferase family protein [Paraburkholderia caballeronis]SEC15684.1 Methyltransferase domain-containing protein [Paraburkholderia caballeronis]SEK67106.1 Methyltransferase domain-containing protein [Paraburkholderia caballeronis]